MLEWLVDNSVLSAAMKSDGLIDEDQVECRPEKVPCSILDETVEISMIRSFLQVKHGWL